MFHRSNIEIKNDCSQDTFCSNFMFGLVRFGQPGSIFDPSDHCIQHSVCTLGYILDLFRHNNRLRSLLDWFIVFNKSRSVPVEYSQVMCEQKQTYIQVWGKTPVRLIQAYSCSYWPEHYIPQWSYFIIHTFHSRPSSSRTDKNGCYRSCTRLRGKQ